MEGSSDWDRGDQWNQALDRISLWLPRVEPISSLFTDQSLPDFGYGSPLRNLLGRE